MGGTGEPRRRTMGPMAMSSGLIATGSVAVLGLALAACSSSGSSVTPSQDAQSEAMQMCENALRVPVAIAVATTVGDIRALTIGPGARPAEHAFGGLADASPAAWCWTGGSGTYTSYGVTPDGQQIQLVSIGGEGDRAPSGPPVVP